MSVQLIDDDHKLYLGEHSTDDVIKRSIQLKKYNAIYSVSNGYNTTMLFIVTNVIL